MLPGTKPRSGVENNGATVTGRPSCSMELPGGIGALFCGILRVFFPVFLVKPICGFLA